MSTGIMDGLTECVAGKIVDDDHCILWDYGESSSLAGCSSAATAAASVAVGLLSNPQTDQSSSFESEMMLYLQVGYRQMALPVYKWHFLFDLVHRLFEEEEGTTAISKGCYGSSHASFHAFACTFLDKAYMADGIVVSRLWQSENGIHSLRGHLDPIRLFWKQSTNL